MNEKFIFSPSKKVDRNNKNNGKRKRKTSERILSFGVQDALMGQAVSMCNFRGCQYKKKNIKQGDTLFFFK